MLRLKPGHKFCLLGRLSTEVGWRYLDTVQVRHAGLYAFPLPPCMVLAASLPLAMRIVTGQFAWTRLHCVAQCSGCDVRDVLEWHCMDLLLCLCADVSDVQALEAARKEKSAEYYKEKKAAVLKKSKEVASFLSSNPEVANVLAPISYKGSA